LTKKPLRPTFFPVVVLKIEEKVGRKGLVAKNNKKNATFSCCAQSTKEKDRCLADQQDLQKIYLYAVYLKCWLTVNIFIIKVFI
jgi:hypothetical protein